MTTRYSRLRLCMSDLIHKHKYHPAIVIGGAPSWPVEHQRVQQSLRFEQLPIVLSANDHGAKKVPCNYIVCCDELEARLRPFGLPIISKFTWADYRIFDLPLPNSALMASWAAWIMGCAPIVIVGVECFQGKTYLDDPDLKTSGHTLPLKEHLKRWERLKQYAPQGQFRPVSGPLLQVFPAYNPYEFGIGPQTPEILLSKCKGTLVKFLRSTEVGFRHYDRGETAELDKFEAHKLHREERVVRAE